VKNNKSQGFSLVEVIIAAAALGGLALVAMNMNKSMSKTSVKFQFDTETNLITNEIVGVLADPAKCSATLLGKNALNETNILSVNGGQYYISSQSGAPASGYGSGGVKITSYALSATSVEVGDKTSYLVINYQTKKILGGPSVVSKKIKLYVEVDATKAITSCHSISAHSPEIWTRGATPDIFYNGNVGIGTTTPQAALDIETSNLPQIKIGDGSTSGSLFYTAYGPTMSLNVGSHWDGAVWKNTHTSSAHIAVGVNGIQFSTDEGLSVGGSDPLTPVMKILNNGRVGIGTLTPNSHFEVQKDFFGVINQSAGFIGGYDAAFAKSGVYFLQKDNASFVSPGTSLINVVQNNVSKFLVTGQGRIGIGTSTPDEHLVITNGITTGKYTTSGWTHVSDKRLKYSIAPLESSLDKIIQLQGVEFKLKKDLTKKKQIGFIAQEVEPVFPEVVLTDNNGIKSMVYSNLVAPLVESVKSIYYLVRNIQSDIAVQNERIDRLEKAMIDLEKENIELRKSLGKK
jgi:prepilin-type N-terminal cleavage/methylation domain-containing protein